MSTTSTKASRRRSPRARVAHRCGTVAIVGRANAGKSTLLNLFMDTKLAAVSPRPQTTWHRILGVKTGDTYQALFLDTPGLMYKTADDLDRHMLQQSLSALQEADLVVLMVVPRPSDRIEERILGDLREGEKRCILAINKVDLAPKESLLPIMEEYSKLYPFLEIVPISALRKDGTDVLLDLIARNLPLGKPLYPKDEMTDRPERFLVAEAIREKLFRLYRQEVPYFCAVEIEEFREAEPPERKKVYISALIYVDRDSQKGILIGKGGEALKRVGTEARRDVEALLGQPVFLELQVKTRPGWRRDPDLLMELGY
ncbi:MAG: GTPase Era [Chloroflexi bacterium]|nr:GTPase Era [Chloroflexota bacterium]